MISPSVSPGCGVIIYYTYLGFRDRAWCLLGLLGLLVEASCARRDLRSLRWRPSHRARTSRPVPAAHDKFSAVGAKPRAVPLAKSPRAEWVGSQKFDSCSPHSLGQLPERADESESVGSNLRTPDCNISSPKATQVHRKQPRVSNQKATSVHRTQHRVA